MEGATSGNAAHLLSSAIPVSSIVRDFDKDCPAVGFAEPWQTSNTAGPVEEHCSSLRIRLPQQEFLVQAPLGSTFTQAQPSKMSESPAARREVESVPSESSILVRIHNLLNSIEESREPKTDDELALRRLAQSTRDLLKIVGAYHERSLANLFAGSGSTVDYDWMRQLLLIVYSELSKLWCGSWKSKQDSRTSFFHDVQGESQDLDEYLSGDPWEENSDLAMEGLLEWFADSLEPPERTQTENLKSVPVENLLGACWEQERRKCMEGDDHLSSTSLSLASASPLSSTGSLTPPSAKSLVPSSASTASTMTSLAPLSSNLLVTSNAYKAWGSLEKIASSEIRASSKDKTLTRLYAPMPTFSLQ
mmetsp:Transcript_47525/g.85801  ORF Transcript_47525/g.85801 Transcript_47525/m.85801 type:complete len:362 (-) Transcript_47525:335-1420(-)